MRGGAYNNNQPLMCRSCGANPASIQVCFPSSLTQIPPTQISTCWCLLSPFSPPTIVLEPFSAPSHLCSFLFISFFSSSFFSLIFVVPFLCVACLFVPVSPLCWRTIVGSLRGVRQTSQRHQGLSGTRTGGWDCQYTPSPLSRPFLLPPPLDRLIYVPSRLCSHLKYILSSHILPLLDRLIFMLSTDTHNFHLSIMTQFIAISIAVHHTASLSLTPFPFLLHTFLSSRYLWVWGAWIWIWGGQAWAGKACTWVWDKGWAGKVWAVWGNRDWGEGPVE